VRAITSNPTALRQSLRELTKIAFHSHSSRNTTVRCNSLVASVQGTLRSWNMVTMNATEIAQSGKLRERDSKKCERELSQASPLAADGRKLDPVTCFAKCVQPQAAQACTTTTRRRSSLSASKHPHGPPKLNQLLLHRALILRRVKDFPGGFLGTRQLRSACLRALCSSCFVPLTSASSPHHSSHPQPTPTSLRPKLSLARRRLSQRPFGPVWR
jgi:hypothetical protein